VFGESRPETEKSRSFYFLQVKKGEVPKSRKQPKGRSDATKKNPPYLHPRCEEKEGRTTRVPGLCLIQGGQKLGGNASEDEGGTSLFSPDGIGKKGEKKRKVGQQFCGARKHENGDFWGRESSEVSVSLSCEGGPHSQKVGWG